MDAAAVDDQITDELLRRLSESRFLHVPLMNRIEGRISSRKQLERYVEVLVGKLEETGFRSDGLINRVDAMTKRLRRYEDAR